MSESFDSLVPLPTGWLEEIVNRHPYAIARTNYRLLLQALKYAKLIPDVIDIDDVIVALDVCVAIFATEEGYEHGVKLQPGMFLLMSHIQAFHRLVRLDSCEDVEKG